MLKKFIYIFFLFVRVELQFGLDSLNENHLQCLNQALSLDLDYKEQKQQINIPSQLATQKLSEQKPVFIVKSW
jgi:hypothetical protein